MKKLVTFLAASLFLTTLIFAQAKEQKAPEPPEKVVISYQLVNAIANYLREKPFKEAEPFLKALQSDLSTVPECPKGDVKDEKTGTVEKQIVPQVEKASSEEKKSE